ncbi:hypothetical protein BX616_004857, partial [Lobosporangium transversale]
MTSIGYDPSSSSPPSRQLEMTELNNHHDSEHSITSSIPHSPPSSYLHWKKALSFPALPWSRRRAHSKGEGEGKNSRKRTLDANKSSGNATEDEILAAMKEANRDQITTITEAELTEAVGAAILAILPSSPKGSRGWDNNSSNESNDIVYDAAYALNQNPHITSSANNSSRGGFGNGGLLPLDSPWRGSRQLQNHPLSHSQHYSFQQQDLVNSIEQFHRPPYGHSQSNQRHDHGRSRNSSNNGSIGFGMDGHRSFQYYDSYDSDNYHHRHWHRHDSSVPTASAMAFARQKHRYVDNRAWSNQSSSPQISQLHHYYCQQQQQQKRQQQHQLCQDQYRDQYNHQQTLQEAQRQHQYLQRPQHDQQYEQQQQQRQQQQQQRLKCQQYQQFYQQSCHHANGLHRTLSRRSSPIIHKAIARLNCQSYHSNSDSFTSNSSPSPTVSSSPTTIISQSQSHSPSPPPSPSLSATNSTGTGSSHHSGLCLHSQHPYLHVSTPSSSPPAAAPPPSIHLSSPQHQASYSPFIHKYHHAPSSSMSPTSFASSPGTLTNTTPNNNYSPSSMVATLELKNSNDPCLHDSNNISANGKDEVRIEGSTTSNSIVNGTTVIEAAATVPEAETSAAPLISAINNTHGRLRELGYISRNARNRASSTSTEDYTHSLSFASYDPQTAAAVTDASAATIVRINDEDERSEYTSCLEPGVADREDDGDEDKRRGGRRQLALQQQQQQQQQQQRQQQQHPVAEQAVYEECSEPVFSCSIPDWQTFKAGLLPRSKHAREALLGTVILALVTIALETILLQRHRSMVITLIDGNVTAGRPFEISFFRPLTVYYSLFILAEVFAVGLLWDAAIHKNSLQLVAFTLFEWCMVSYSGLQIWQHDQLVKDIGISDELLIHLGDIKTRTILFSQFGVQVTACIGITLLTWRLYSEFGWLVFQKLGADVSLRKMMKEYRLLFTLLKLDAFFFFGYAIQIAILTDKYWQKGLTEVAFAVPLSCIIILLGFCA